VLLTTCLTRVLTASRHTAALSALLCWSRSSKPPNQLSCGAIQHAACHRHVCAIYLVSVHFLRDIYGALRALLPPPLLLH
jgi:hypothetical protein